MFRAHHSKSMGAAATLDDDENLPNLAELHSKIDQTKISSLSNVKFTEAGIRILLQLYEEISQNTFFNNSFSYFYQKMIDGVITQVKEE